jgi:NAD(P)-dependent dehydrogenase (short-subunit alcohol dehydrogenase family)
VGRLEARNALVTGASRGIGAATAQLLAQEGADVAILARGDGLQEVAARVRAEGSRGVEVRVDVGDREALEAAVSTAASKLGGLDVVVVAAAATAFGAFDEIRPEDFDRCMAVTFGGAVDTIRAVLPHLERAGGTLVVVGSAVDVLPLILMGPYVAAKSALSSFLDVLRAELRAKGSDVTVSEVRPGPVDSPFWRHATHPEDVTPPRLPPLTSYSAESVARVVVACAVRPRTVVTVGGSILLLQVANKLARPLTERVLALGAMAGRATASTDEVANALWSASGDGTVKGGLAGRPSLWAALRLAGSRPHGLKHDS